MAADAMLPFLLVLAAAVVATIVYAVRERQRADDAMRRAAVALGLRRNPGSLFKAASIAGTTGGYRLVVDTFTQGSGNHSTTYTRYRVRFKSLGLGLKLAKQGFMSRIAAVFGAQDIEIGAERFDAAVIVQGKDRKAVTEWLTPGRQRAVLRTFDLGKCTILDDEIRLVDRGRPTEPRAIVRRVERLIGIADVLLGQSKEQEHLDEALAVQEHGDLSRALEILQAAPAEARGTETKQSEAELLYTAGRYDEAADAFSDLEQVIPDQEDVKRWAERARKRAREPLFSKPEEPPAEPAAPEVPLDVETVCRALFDSNLMSYEATQLFEERYAGKGVRWGGKLTRADTFSFDLVFGSAAGTKLVVELLELGEGLFGGQRIDAIVGLSEKREDLGDRVGQPVTFEGELMRCDSLMRNVYVGKAKLVVR